MRLAHKYDWHYAPRIGPFEDGRTQLWCTWCGFRETQGVARGVSPFGEQQVANQSYPTDTTPHPDYW